MSKKKSMTEAVDITVIQKIRDLIAKHCKSNGITAEVSLPVRQNWYTVSLKSSKLGLINPKTWMNYQAMYSKVNYPKELDSKVGGGYNGYVNDDDLSPLGTRLIRDLLKIAKPYDVKLLSDLNYEDPNSPKFKAKNSYDKVKKVFKGMREKLLKTISKDSGIVVGNFTDVYVEGYSGTFYANFRVNIQPKNNAVFSKFSKEYVLDSVQAISKFKDTMKEAGEDTKKWDKFLDVCKDIISYKDDNIACGTLKPTYKNKISVTFWE